MTERGIVPRGLDRAAAWSWRLLVIAAAVVGIVSLLVRLKVVVVPMIVAGFVAAALMPLMRRLIGAGVPSTPAASGLVVAGLVLVGGAVALLIPRAVDQVGDLQSSLDRAIGTLSGWLADTLGVDLDALVSRARDILTRDGDLGSWLVGGAVVAGEFIAGLLLAIVLSFFALRDGQRAIDAALTLVPDRHLGLARTIGRRAWAVMGRYLQGVIIVGLVDAVAIGIGLAVIGVPLVLVLMVLTFVGAFFPLVGATVAGAVAVLVALVSGGVGDAVLTLALIVGIQQLEGQLLAPVVYGRALNIHPVVVLLALASGAVLGGVIGAAFAVPLAAMLLAAIEEIRRRRRWDRLRAEGVLGDSVDPVIRVPALAGPAGS